MRRCRARREVTARNELAWLHQISEASKRQEKQDLRRQIVGEVEDISGLVYSSCWIVLQALTHISQLNKLKHEYSSLETGQAGQKNILQTGRAHDVSYEEGEEGGQGLQRGRAGRPLKHKTPREKQSAHSKL